MNNLLKNNSESMKTIVETFLTEETIDLIYDNEQLDAWNKYVDELGLSGQRNVVKKDKSPIPFMHLKKSYVRICETICPRKVSIESYNITPIPVEILELVALSKREKYFEEIVIWYDDKSPDPFCLGVNHEYYSVNGNSWKTRHPNYESALNEMNEKGWEGKPAKPWDSGTYYLIGKWADVKKSWDELKEIAMNRYMKSEKISFEKAIKEAQRGLEDLKIKAYEQFN